MKTINRLSALLVLLITSNFILAANASSNDIRTSFSKGSTSVGIVAGSGRSFNNNYIILGAGVGYYVIDGLKIGFDAERWLSGTPSITKISPQIKYVFTLSKTLQPYAGTFYTWTFIDDLDTQQSYGYRAGAYFSTKNNLNIGAGFVYEKYKNCDLFVSCSNTYPEILVTISF